MGKDGSITVPVFCGRAVIARIKLVPTEDMTKEEFITNGLRVLTETIMELVTPN